MISGGLVRFVKSQVQTRIRICNPGCILLKRKAVAAYQEGTKTKIGIARALLPQPSLLLLLDEPTTGLDPQSRHVDLWEAIHQLNKKIM